MSMQPPNDPDWQGQPWQPQDYSQPTQQQPNYLPPQSFQPPGAPQPGQFQPGQLPPLQSRPKRSRRRLWLILGIIGGAVLLCCIVSGIAAALTPSAPVARATPTVTATQGAILAVTITDTPTATPTIIPTPSPTPKPTPTPKPVIHLTPTPRPQPTPTHCVGVNSNPWCYDFNPGNYIYSPPSAFCSYFSCVSTFWTATRGYVAECGNGEYTHSGGVSGACSRDGGVSRPLYSH